MVKPADRLRRKMIAGPAVWFRYLFAGFVMTFVVSWIFAGLDLIDENYDELLRDQDFNIIYDDVYFDYGSRRDVRWVYDVPLWLIEKYPEQYVNPDDNSEMVSQVFGDFVEDAHGWPIPAFESVHWRSLIDVIYNSLVDTDTVVTSWDENLWCIAYTRKGEYGSVQPILTLPLKPILLGSFIDTLFYAVLIFYTFRGGIYWLQLRRVRRSLCPQCSYILEAGSEHGCPECGWGRLQ